MSKEKRTPGAVAKAWAIFNKQPKAKRAVVLTACTKAGIKDNTARSQYQSWKHASPAQRQAKVTGHKGPTQAKKGTAKQSTPKVEIRKAA